MVAWQPNLFEKIFVYGLVLMGLTFIPVTAWLIVSWCLSRKRLGKIITLALAVAVIPLSVPLGHWALEDWTRDQNRQEQRLAARDACIRDGGIPIYEPYGKSGSVYIGCAAAHTTDSDRIMHSKDI